MWPPLFGNTMALEGGAARYEARMRRACGVMDRSTFLRTIDRLDITPGDAARMLEEYDADSALLSVECRLSFKGGAQLSGDAKKRTTKKTAKKKKKKTIKTTKKAATAKSVAWAEECSKNYDVDRGCVYDTLDGKKPCIPPTRVAGDEKQSAMTDGYCYDQASISSHVRKTRSFVSPMVAEHRFTAADARRMDRTRLQSLAEFSIVRVLTKSVERAVDTTQQSQTETMEALYKQLHADGKETTLMWGVRLATSWLGTAAKAFASFAVKTGMSLAKFVASQPRTARFLVIIVRRMLHQTCERIAMVMQKREFANESTLDYFTRKAGDAASDSAAVAEIVVDEFTSRFTSSDGGKRLMTKASSAVGALFLGTLRRTPFIGGIADALDSVGEEVNAAVTTSLQIGIEFALYQKDVTGAFKGVLDILVLVLNPGDCVRQHMLDTTEKKT